MDAPDADFLAGVVAQNIAAVARQTREGLRSTRRTGGRIVTPFMATLSGQERATGLRGGGAPSHVEVRASDADDEQWDSLGTP